MIEAMEMPRDSLPDPGDGAPVQPVPRPAPDRALAALRPTLAPLVALRWLPMPLLALAALMGGWWMVPALAATLLAVFVQETPDAPVDDAGGGPDLAIALALGSAGLLPLLLFALTGGAALGFWGWLGLLVAASLWFGQLGAAAGHALIHMPGREGDLGAAYFCLFWAGPFVSAHRLVHHPAAATPDDPFTADEGEGFWGYAARAWPAGFVAGWEMEAAIARTAPGGRAPVLHPYVFYAAVSLAVTLALSLIAGAGGMILHLILSALVQMQLLLADYLRHHGRLRRRDGLGEVAPFGPAHEWVAPDPFAGLRGHHPRPGDHLLHDGAAPGPVTGAAPRLPASFPVMAFCALVPPLFARMMARRRAAPLAARRPARGATPGG